VSEEFEHQSHRGAHSKKPRETQHFQRQPSICEASGLSHLEESFANNYLQYKCHRRCSIDDLFGRKVFRSADHQYLLRTSAILIFIYQQPSAIEGDFLRPQQDSSQSLDAESAKAKPDVSSWAARFGHCKTASNGFWGTTDSLDGATVVVEWQLAEKEKWGNGLGNWSRRMFN